MRASGSSSTERGTASVATILFLPVALLLAALVLDVGSLLYVRRSLRVAADMGALAGAQEVDLEALWQGRRRLLEDEARQKAAEAAELNASANLPRFVGVASPSHTEKVYNAEEESHVVHPGTSRVLRDPTICVTISLPVRFGFATGIPGLSGLVTVSAHADASVLERTEGK